MSESLRLGIAGLGNVGSSLVRLLERHGNDLAIRCGRAIDISGVSARDPRRSRGIDLSSRRWFDDPVAMAQNNVWNSPRSIPVEGRARVW